jgi:large subunit ribosomal protein L2
MALKTFRPLTPTNRFKALPSFDEITKSKPEKSLSRPSTRPVGAITTAALPAGILAAGTSRSIGSSISSARSATSKPK